MTAREGVEQELVRLARTIEPHLAPLDAGLRRGTSDATRCKPLLMITAGAAARMFLAGHTEADFLEQVAYNSRRLAKLNVSPAEVVDALRGYDRGLASVLSGSRLDGIRQHLHFRTLSTVYNAYYEVREAETQAFYGLLRAEMEASGLEDLLERFIRILTRTFRAQAGRLFPFDERPAFDAVTLKRLQRSRYIVRGAGESLILDAEMRGRYPSYWSIPYFEAGRFAGLVQFGFDRPYRWLPRELDLLEIFAERCLRAADRVRLIQELSAREQQVRALAGRLLEAEHEERGRISRELHDEAGQSMLFLRLHLEMLEKRVPPELQPGVAEARSVTETIIQEIRRVIGALRPSVVEELGLPAAIRHLGARFRKLHPIRLRMRLTPYGGNPQRGVENTVYRVVQECFQNIARHAGATRVNLRLRSTDKWVELNVEDDGGGFDPAAALAKPGSFGLKGMRERVTLLGGCLEIRSSPGRGTAILVRLPLLPTRSID